MFRTSVQRTDGEPVDVAVVGAGLAGMATALRLQAAGLSTVVLEAHGHPGGCAGWFRKRGFSFDVGATTLVDFGPGGVGAELLTSVGLGSLDAEPLPGYRAFLPDRDLVLYRDPQRWHAERLRVLGDTEAHRRFWALLDELAAVFWRASRAGVTLPVRDPATAWRDARAVGVRHLPLARYVTWTMGDALRRHGLREDAPLTGLLAMLVEDTVHAGLDRAPLVNAALGVTIRGAGLYRHTGGMHGFWRGLLSRYRELGGRIRFASTVTAVAGRPGAYTVTTRREVVAARRVVLAIPAQGAARVCAGLPLAARLGRFVRRDADELGGACVVFLGVPDEEVAQQELTHHQLLDSYTRPLGEGNNMFVSVSAPGDAASAPPGHRAVMISTHTELSSWRGLDEPAYQQRKKELGEHLVTRARQVYPQLAERAVYASVATPRAYARFAHRPFGAVGGPRQHPGNANQHAVPHDLAGRGSGLWLVGDSTWPGLGTVACVLSSRIVAEGMLRERGFRR
jgi:C-3',4' desaturase CrtD